MLKGGVSMSEAPVVSPTPVLDLDLGRKYIHSSLGVYWLAPV